MCLTFFVGNQIKGKQSEFYKRLPGSLFPIYYSRHLGLLAATKSLPCYKHLNEHENDNKTSCGGVVKSSLIPGCTHPIIQALSIPIYFRF